MSEQLADIRQRVIKITQELLSNASSMMTITPDIIAENIEKVLTMEPRWREGLDKDLITNELIRRCSIWIGKDTLLVNDEGHEAWLVATRKKDWRYWQRYREWLEQKLPPAAVEALDQSTDSVIALLEDPLRDGSWDRRGLVVGHIQSGKTGHYTGLICKAADAGYKIVIVLAGLHNNLRSQTQIRLDEGFLGYKTNSTQDNLQSVGVGIIDSDPNIRPNFATNRSDKGDFTTRVAQNFGITPEQRPWLFVVKKNKTVLEHLLAWIRNQVADFRDQENNRNIVTQLPLLIIDDEADHASVDTGEQVLDSDGRLNEEHQPTTINRLIRRTLLSFARSAYVGYTATPFANIFIHERGKTFDEGLDLFPSAFIINLAAPSNYIGPMLIFGQKNEEENSNETVLVRLVDDHSTEDGVKGWMPKKHKNNHTPFYNGEQILPPSLVQAIHSFVLACAVREVRGQGNEHISMLIHVTRFNSVQQNVCSQVEQMIQHLRQRLTRKIDHEQILSDIKSLWDNDFVPTYQKIQKSHTHLITDDFPTWSDIMTRLADVVSDIQIMLINGSAKDALDYSEHKDTGLKVIVIGGEKLARGLTLEGLCISYFLRASRMYDTLMQMGRWFGYRPSYLELCRLYTTSELSEWFEHITDAAEELREEFDIMSATGATPREYGLKVQAHPVLMVTSKLKMRSARDLMLSFSGQLLETIAFYKTKHILEENLTTAKRFVSSLGTPEKDPLRIRNGSHQKWTGSFVWTDISTSTIVEFLMGYRTHPDAHKVNSSLLADFIRKMSHDGELTHWTVALIGGGVERFLTLRDDIKVRTMKRKMKNMHEDRYSIGRLISPRDESIDFDEDAWIAALELTQNCWHSDSGRRGETTNPIVPNGPAIRAIRGFGSNKLDAHPERGVLLLYGLDPLEAEAGFGDDTPPIMAFAISFPGSSSSTTVKYKVNNVGWESEYGSAE